MNKSCVHSTKDILRMVSKIHFDIQKKYPYFQQLVHGAKKLDRSSKMEDLSS